MLHDLFPQPAKLHPVDSVTYTIGVSVILVGSGAKTILAGLRDRKQHFPNQGSALSLALRAVDARLPDTTDLGHNCGLLLTRA